MAFDLVLSSYSENSIKNEKYAFLPSRLKTHDVDSSRLLKAAERKKSRKKNRTSSIRLFPFCLEGGRELRGQTPTQLKFKALKYKL